VSPRGARSPHPRHHWDGGRTGLSSPGQHPERWALGFRPAQERGTGSGARVCRLSGSPAVCPFALCPLARSPSCTWRTQIGLRESRIRDRHLSTPRPRASVFPSVKRVTGRPGDRDGQQDIGPGGGPGVETWRPPNAASRACHESASDRLSHCRPPGVLDLLRTGLVFAQ
jgi:hypothetical protein